jgi:hypothetical protein
MRFDWMQATVREDALRLVETLAAGLDADVTDGRGMNGYTRSFRLQKGGDTVGTVLAGGRNGNPNAFASGDATDAFVPVLRAAYAGDHYVTRMDCAEDLCAPGLFDELTNIARAIADEKKLRLRTDGDWLREIDGRTLYIGAPTSPVRVRIYEKGKQLLSTQRSTGVLRTARADVSGGLHLDTSGEPDPNWVRVEAQVRPTKEAREAASAVSPEGGWGYAAWTQEFAARVLDVNVERVVQQTWRQSDADRALAFMVAHYGATAEHFATQLGSWEAFGEMFGTLHADNVRRKEARHG